MGLNFTKNWQIDWESTGSIGAYSVSSQEPIYESRLWFVIFKGVTGSRSVRKMIQIGQLVSKISWSEEFPDRASSASNKLFGEKKIDKMSFLGSICAFPY